jgi:sugar/nucleoside kinase (ribokinase family)
MTMPLVPPRAFGAGTQVDVVPVQFGVPLVVVKLGREGALAQRGSERFVSPALTVEAVDAVGAGDSFDAGFLNQYVRGVDLPACLAAGNLAGAFSTTRPGGTEAFRDAKYRTQFFGEHGPGVA